MFSIKKLSTGSIIAYGITFAFLALAAFFTLSANSQDQAFISSELGLATFSPNGPAGGMLVAASGCSSGGEGGGGCPTPPTLGTWSTGAWGACSGACGTTGTQSRSVSCSNANGCAGARPASTRSCTSTACTPGPGPGPGPGTWTTGTWGSCTGACGTTGSQTRSVTCSSPGTCSGSAPASTRSCTTTACALPPPTVNFQVEIIPATVRYSSSQIYVAPDEDLRLIWTSSNASSCTTNFGGVGTSGTETDTPTLDPGENRVYQVICRNSAGDTTARTITASVPNIVIDRFEINPSLVRSGATATLEWQLELDNSLTKTPVGDLTPFSYPCTISGAIASSPYSFDASTNAGAGTQPTRVLDSKYTSTLQCNSFVRGETSVEIVPTTEEI